MLPTVEQAHVPRNSFPRWRVAARTAQHSSAPRGDDLRLQAAVQVRSARSMSFLPLRVRKAVVEAGSVRDGP